MSTPHTRPGAPATRHAFTAAQIAYLDSFIPEFETQTNLLDPDFNGYCKKLSSWKAKTAKEIMSHPLFESLPSETEPLRKWVEAVKRRFTNHFNNNMKRKTSKINIKKDSSLDSSDQKKIDGIIMRALAIFRSDQSSARDLYAQQNEDLIKDKMVKISPENPGLVGGGLRNKALSLLWADADQRVWENNLQALVADTDLNQSEFPLLVARALQGICSRKCLGSTYMSLSYGFRDDMGSIQGGTVYAGYDCAMDVELAPVPPEHDEQLDTFLEWADSVIPKKVRHLTSKFLTDKSGLPLCPAIDMVAATMGQLTDLLTRYITAVWEFSWPTDEEMSSIPWEKIASDPTDFYDTAVFRLPYALKCPELYANSLGHMICLIEYFPSVQPPFRFRAKDDILKRITNQPQMVDESVIPFDSVPQAVVRSPSQASSYMSNAAHVPSPSPSPSPSLRPSNTLPSPSPRPSNTLRPVVTTPNVTTHNAATSVLPNTAVEPSPEGLDEPTHDVIQPPKTRVGRPKKGVTGKNALAGPTKPTPPIRASTRKRSAPQPSSALAQEPARKRQKPGWFNCYEHEDGRLTDDHGNLVDKNGNILEQ